MTIDRSLCSKILVIKLRAIGDVLLSTIVTKNLRLAFPHATIHYLVEPPSVPVVRGNPFVNDVLVYDKSTMSGVELIRRVRGERYAMIIDLFGNPRTALVTRLSGATYRVGYRFRGRSYAYNLLVEPRGGFVHNTQFNLDALESIGVAIQDRNLYFQFDEDAAAFVDAFVRQSGLDGRFCVCLNPGGGWYTKRWGGFAELGDQLARRYDAAVILSWGPGELEDVEKVRAQMKSPAFIPPGTTLAQLGALLKRCAMVVTNDSGPMHIAAALGVPVLGIYGPTNPVLQGPYGDQHCVVRNESVGCLGCNLTSCPIHHPCMKELSVAAVMRGVEELLRKNNLLLK